MLLEIACSNHKSIHDEVFFSLIAGNDSSISENVMNVSGLKVLKSAAIYGPNGSGKSNFINAIAFIKNLVINSINHQPGQGILQIRHKLSEADEESTYKMQFIINNIRYAFGFTLKNSLVTYEYLYYFPNLRQAKIYERVENNFTVGSGFRSKFNAVKEVLKPNRLFLSCAANFSAVEEIASVFSFFMDDIVIYNIANQDDWMNYSLYQINNNIDVKEKVLSFLEELGTGIKDIEVQIDRKALEESQLPHFLSDEFKKILLQNEVNAISAKVIYENFCVDLMQEESTGVKKLFGMLCPLIDIISHNKVLICDEIEASLHESLIYEVLKAFINTGTANFAQMIFTTHEIGLLNFDLFRKDQIWFTELKKDRSTDLYSLAEIQNVRKDDNFKRGYIMGKYGAVPVLNHNLSNFLSSL